MVNEVATSAPFFPSTVGKEFLYAVEHGGADTVRIRRRSKDTFEMMEEIAVPFNSSDVDVVPSPANPMSIHGIPGADAYCIMARSRRNDVYPPVGQDYVSLILAYDFSGNQITRRYCPTKKYGPRVFYAGFTGYIDPNSFEPYWFLQTYRDFRDSR